MATVEQRLDTREWRSDQRGWDCPLLKFPTAAIHSLAAPDLGRLSTTDYDADTTLGVVRWLSQSAPPSSVTVAVSLDQGKFEQDAKWRWRLQYVIVPILLALIPVVGGLMKPSGGGQTIASVLVGGILNRTSVKDVKADCICK